MNILQVGTGVTLVEKDARRSVENTIYQLAVHQKRAGHKVKVVDTFKGCKYFVPNGFCKLDQISACTDYIASKGTVLSHSQLRVWERCLRLWYYQYILLLELLPQYQSIELRQGSELHRLISKIPSEPQFFFPEEDYVKEIH